jgi:hypothetical protein
MAEPHTWLAASTPFLPSAQSTALLCKLRLHSSANAALAPCDEGDRREQPPDGASTRMSQNLYSM